MGTWASRSTWSRSTVPVSRSVPSCCVSARFDGGARNEEVLVPPMEADRPDRRGQRGGGRDCGGRIFVVRSEPLLAVDQTACHCHCQYSRGSGGASDHARRPEGCRRNQI